MPYVLRAFAKTLSREREAARIWLKALSKAWRFSRIVHSGSNLKAWLFTILRNEYYSQQRRAGANALG